MPRVLIVEDNPDVMSLIDYTLVNAGFDVEHADDGAIAVQKAMQSPPSAVVLDVLLPGLDGFEVLRALQGAQQTYNTPVLMLSSRQQEDDIVRALESGASDYMVKPFSPRELVSRLRRLLKNAGRNVSIALVERKLNLIQSLDDLAGKLADAVTTPEMYQMVLDESLRATSAQSGSLMVVKEGVLVIGTSVGLDAEVVHAVRVPIGHGIAGDVASTGNSKLVQNIAMEEAKLAAPEGRYTSGTLISVPVKVRGAVAAVLNVNTKEGEDLFSTDDLEALELIAKTAALALMHAEDRSH